MALLRFGTAYCQNGWYTYGIENKENEEGKVIATGSIKHITGIQRSYSMSAGLSNLERTEYNTV